MKTDDEVIADAITLLEEDEGWCQGNFYEVSPHTSTGLSFCAEGALREAAGFWMPSRSEVSLRQIVDDGGPIQEQIARVTERIVHSDSDFATIRLRYFNDAESTSKEDAVLAFKKALEDKP